MPDVLEDRTSCAFKLLATPTLLDVTSDEGDMSDVLEDRTSCAFKLLARRTLLPKRIAQLIVLEDHPVRIEAFLTAGLLAYAIGEIAGVLVLHPAHHLQLSSTTTSRRPKDDELLTATTTPTSLVLLLVHEEHEHAPLLFQCTKCCSAYSGDIADAVAWDVDNGAIIPVLPSVDKTGPSN